MNAKTNSTINFPIIALIISGISFFVASSALTAYNWPIVDMALLIERLLNPDFLKNDFCINAAATPNPRFIYGFFLIGLMKLFQASWYDVFFFLKLWTILTLPVLLYAALWGCIRNYLKQETAKKTGAILLAGFVSACLFEFVSFKFTIGQWLPIYLGPIPYTASFYVCLCAVIALMYLDEKKWLVSGCLFALGTLLHPTLGLYSFCFFALLLSGQLCKRRLMILFLSSVVLPIIAILIIFKSPASLSGQELAQIYAHERAPHHYLPSGWHWTWPYKWAAINVLFIGAMTVFKKGKEKAFFILACLFMGAYNFVILAQYLFVEVFPIKPVVKLGPARFLIFGFWMLATLYTLILSKLALVQKIANVILNSIANISRPKRVYGFALILCLFVSMNYLKDDPLIERRAGLEGFYDWIAKTKEEAVFISYDLYDLNVDIGLIGRRASFISQAYPFSEESMREYSKRRKMAFGDVTAYRGKARVSQEIDNFQNKTRGDFLKIKKEHLIDYIIFKKPVNSSFRSSKPAFENEIIAVYHLKS